ncbi:DUF2809 domain-containing protein [Lacinutrix sp. Bg11-31]|uniref:ribosomal maturation YjgA family protein n=1 Tax=Lacinutrix sp. Bg11-31 TaxID=2057808 RepID=UPI000C31955A|nr:DUF2809 domain-containing protein [Lacinutrix sp. Bg11-31]AUC80772.1 DUF2809 domain-containing protein [Lacinutrix sp. Bg11-31]
MKITFQPYYFAVFYTLLLVEIAIALLLKGGFIRHTFGDFLSVIVLYCLIKSFVDIKPGLLTIIVLLIAFVIEFLQLANILDFLNLRDNRLIATIFGTSFSIQDLVAYTLGALFILITDIILTKKASKK